MSKYEGYESLKALADFVGVRLSSFEDGFVPPSPPELTEDEYDAMAGREAYIKGSILHGVYERNGQVLSSTFVKLDADGKPVKRSCI